MILRHAPRRPTTPASPGARRARSERGETLIELMATMILLGICITALVASLITAIQTSATHRRIIRTGNETINVVEVIRGMAYVPCATTTTYGTTNNIAGYTVPQPDFTVEITQIRWLTSNTASPAVWKVPGSGCTAANDQGAQQITVRVTSKSGPGTIRRSLTFVKRNKATDL
jgi:type II secretory pathway pseudopilin PulG